MKKWTRLVTLILILIAAVFLFMWISLNGNWSNFGLNAFTETLGILITVLIVDHLIKRQEEARLLPLQVSSYEDVRLLTSRIVSFWMDAYRLSVPGPPPSSIADLFNKESFERMGSLLNLDSNPNVIPKRTWWEHLPENLNDFKKRSETILERHHYILDPETYLAVHKIATEGLDPGMIRSIKQLDQQIGFPRPRILANFWLIPDEYCETILALINWCEKKAVTLEAAGITRLKKVISSIHQWEPQTAPPCMISDEELENQAVALALFREKNKNSA